MLAGPPECHGIRQTLDVQRAGVALGQVRACFQGQRRLSMLAGLSVLAAACLVLWTAAALLAGFAVIEADSGGESPETEVLEAAASGGVVATMIGGTSVYDRLGT